MLRARFYRAVCGKEGAVPLPRVEGEGRVAFAKTRECCVGYHHTRCCQPSRG